MDFLGKAVRFQHRIATGHARLRPGSAGQATRHHIPVPTKLEVVDAIVLLEVHVEGEDFPRVSLLYPTGKAMNGADYQNSIAVAHDVPHASHSAADGGMLWEELSDAESSVRLVNALEASRAQLDAERRENELLRAKWEASTEGTDEKLQKMADEGAKSPDGVIAALEAAKAADDGSEPQQGQEQASDASQGSD
jgi:hypothetical protein